MMERSLELRIENACYRFFESDAGTANYLDQLEIYWFEIIGSE